MHRKPYNPATAGPQAPVHDRRAKQVSRGAAAYVVESETDDPYAPGERIAVLRSVRGDPLLDHYSRGHVDECQFTAGREFQRHWEIAECGPRAIQLTERVDHGRNGYDGLSPIQVKAWQWLARVRHEIGVAGMMLLHEMLVENRSAKQVVRARGLEGVDWQRFFMKWLRLCLEAVAGICGFASKAR